MKIITAVKRSDGQNGWPRSAMGLLLTLLAAAPVLAPAQGVISSSYFSGVDLDALFLPPANSVAVNPGVTIENNNSGGDAVFGSSTNWALMNSGTLDGNNDGVNFGAGGSVNNLTTNAIITGINNNGVEITNGLGFVVNAGTITSLSAYGVGNDGVLLGGGGSVSNLTANARIKGGMNGVEVRGTNGMVVNNGGIIGYGNGVVLSGGGSVNNLTTNAFIGGGMNGVEITNGLGSVVNAGTIGSANDNGVLLGSGGSVSNLTANARIKGGMNGVQIQGTNGMVVNNGAISGYGNGVLLSGGGSVNNLTTNALIAGYNNGVEITNGLGTVVNAGTIIGTNNTGVFYEAGGSVNNLAGGSIAGKSSGIFINGGAGFVTNAGSITSYGNDGVHLSGNGSSVNNLAGGTIKGVTGVDIDGDGGSVANAGSIMGTNGFGVYLVQGGSVNNLSGGTITGGIGVMIDGGGGSVANAGSIMGTVGENGGVWLVQGGSVNNLSGGIITGEGTGVIINGVGSVDNAGLIMGTRSVDGVGVLLSQGGSVNNLSGGTIVGNGLVGAGVSINGNAGFVTNAGTISGSGDGVYLGLGGSVMNLTPNALIASGMNGVKTERANGMVVNVGTISGTNWNGVLLGDGGSVNNLTTNARITGGGNGVEITNGLGSVANAGTIASPNNAGVLLGSGGSVSNLTANARIMGGMNGVETDGTNGMVVNAGTISGTNQNGVLLGDGGSVNNLTTNSLITGGNNGVEISGTNGSVDNNGSITGYANDGVFLNKGGSVSNMTANALIAGANVGVEIDSYNGMVVNAGTIIGTNNHGVYLGQVGVGLGHGGTVNNLTTDSLIIGGYNGVEIYGTNGSVYNNGTISGLGNDGVYLGNYGTHDSVYNNGTISGLGKDGVYLGSGGSVSNQAGGSIQGGQNGIEIWGGTGSVVNAGTITGSVAGVYLGQEGGSVNNDGGTIVGGGFGVVIIGPATVVNSGTIIGSNGTAIMLEFNYTNTVTLQTGSDVQGDIVAGGLMRGTNNTAILQGNGSFDNNFTNFQTLTVQADSTGWDLNGTNAFSTVTSVQNGLLRINGRLTTPWVTVADASGGLGGAGTINGIVDNHGYFAPGTANNPIGALTINGALTNWGDYYADVNKAGNSDLIRVNGLATINNGNVILHPALGTYAPNTVYTILTATNGISGAYDGVSTIYPLFFSAALSNDLNDVFVTLNQKPFTSVAGTYNQNAVAGALDRSMNSPSATMSNLITGLLQLSSVAQAQAALNSLGGEIHGTLGVLDGQQQDDFNNAIAQRTGRISSAGRSGDFATSWKPVQLASAGSSLLPMEQADENQPLSLWLQGLGSFGHLESDSNAQGGNYAIGGMSGGMDYRVTPDLLAGLGLGFTRDNADVGGPGANGTVNAYQLGGYGGYVSGPWHLDSILSYGYLCTDTKRFINVGSLSQEANGSYAGGVFSVSAEGGYAFTYDRLTAEPSIGLNYAHLWQDSFSETASAGGNNYGLDVHSVDRDSVRTTLGLRLAAQLGRKGGVQFIPALHALWEHEFADRYADVNASFVGGSGTFDTHGVQLAADSALLGGGLTVAFNHQVQGFVNYDASLNSQLTSSTVSGGLSISW